MTHIRNINAQKTKREAEIRSFFCEHKISPRLTSRVWHYVRQNKAAGMARTKTEDITTLRELPAVLLNDLREEVLMPVLKVHPLFNEHLAVSHVVLREVAVRALTEKTFKGGQEVYQDWHEVYEMVFVLRGT